MGSESNEIVDGVPAAAAPSGKLISDRYVAGTGGLFKGQMLSEIGQDRRSCMVFGGLMIYSGQPRKDISRVRRPTSIDI